MRLRDSPNPQRAYSSVTVGRQKPQPTKEAAEKLRDEAQLCCTDRRQPICISFSVFFRLENIVLEQTKRNIAVNYG